MEKVNLNNKVGSWSYLIPVYEHVKSFYRKAKVYELEDGIALRSYKTLVAVINMYGEVFVRGTFSATTLRHIKEFLRQYNIEGWNNKNSIIKLFHFRNEKAWVGAEKRLLQMEQGRYTLISSCRYDDTPIFENFVASPPLDV